jgi:hypothetical protein
MGSVDSFSKSPDSFQCRGFGWRNFLGFVSHPRRNVDMSRAEKAKELYNQGFS